MATKRTKRLNLVLTVECRLRAETLQGCSRVSVLAAFAAWKLAPEVWREETL